MTVQTRSSLHVHVTPPGSFTACPLTPPPTDEKSTTSAVLRIIEDIQNRKTKTSGAVGVGAGVIRVPVPWAVYSLDVDGYRDLLQRIQRDENLAGFAEHKLRLDYFPSTRRLVLRMPTAVHEYFIFSVVEEIKTQLKTFSGISGEEGGFAQAIKCGGSARIKFDDPDYGAHDPDGQFKHCDAQFPGVVIEVSFSQKKRDLPHLADDYILGSDSNIKMVIGLDIEYRGTEKMATWSVWEPGIEKDEDGDEVLIAKQTADNKVFRTPTGTPSVLSPSSNLHIPLHAFAPSSCYPSNIPPTGSITIPAKTLCTFLQEAENTASMIVQKTGLVEPPTTKTWGKKRRREITPEEELLERDEKKFKTEEDKALELETKDDGSFVGSEGS